MEGGSGGGTENLAQGDTDQPASWLEKQQREAASFSMEDCPECRYVGGIGLYVTALYVGYTSLKRQKLRGAKSIWGAVPALTVSGCKYSRINISP